MILSPTVSVFKDLKKAPVGHLRITENVKTSYSLNYHKDQIYNYHLLYY